jgi:hypothetical protein
MGYRRPIPLKFLWLALAWGQLSFLGSQAAPALATTGVAGVQAGPTEAEGFRKHSLSHLRLQRGNRYIDVYLFAPDEKVEVLKDPYCGGDEGAKAHSGHFQLISVVHSVQVSTMNLDPDDWFVEGKTHDGARLLHDPKTGQDIVALYQYGTCSSETVQFVSSDTEGHLFSIPFLDRDGRTWKQMLTGSGGAIPHLASGALVFCSYANGIGYNFCGAYAFDGANFLEAAKWMTPELEAPIKGLNDAGQAARTLFDFLSALSVKSYAAAAYYADASVETLGARPTTANPGKKATFLETYCTVMGGQCFTPVVVESKPSADAQGALLFQVSFQTPDFEPLRIGSHSSFGFRVAKTPSGFKVLDLPPRIP